MEILAKHLGLEGASTVKTPGDKNGMDNAFRYRDVDGEENGPDCETACYVDELFMKRRHGASQQQNITKSKSGFIGGSNDAYKRIYPSIAEALERGDEVEISYIDYDTV